MLFKQLGEQLPKTAQFYREETGRGDQRLVVGGTPYYCQWVGGKMTWDDGEGNTVTAVSKTWRSIDVPIDGVVKEESTLSSASGFELSRTSKVLIGCGSAGRACL